ncbi:hypothetical protein [Neisseria sp.]|uniref:hypothetical protein n=1 Tax=Neisseria sp. TaxID=192066 RepID=UPI0026DAE076|nr:hypothetical protein [Neisseria sp.]MDO4227551.1 hypothetical protein [Neisseria sp.]
MSSFLVESENGTPHYFDDFDDAVEALNHPLSSGYLWQVDDDGNRLLWGGESFEPAVYVGDGIWYSEDEWDYLHSEDYYANGESVQFDYSDVDLENLF